uniref:Uncharacterized protein n=1 Tax=Populus alba TaxID=43335 RepID=A0A4U5QLB6_POPAL|nr:hypothetical protein D5086_0000072460 [Populus alba]
MGFLSGARLLVSRCPVAASQRNDEGNLPIHVACQKGHLEVVRELLVFWLDPMDFLNEKGQNILQVAAESGQMKIVDEILKNRDLEALINEKDYDGNTPLHLAAMYGRPEIVQALVSDKRVDKTIVNNEKLKPSGVVAILLQGGRFEAPNSDGMNMLIDTKHEDDAARGVGNKSQDVEVRKLREVLKVLVEAGDKTEFDINLNFDLTTLTTEERNRGVGNLLVVAVLVGGVTFAGAITVPGSGSDLSSDVVGGKRLGITLALEDSLLFLSKKQGNNSPAILVHPSGLFSCCDTLSIRKSLIMSDGDGDDDDDDSDSDSD